LSFVSITIAAVVCDEIRQDIGHKVESEEKSERLEYEREKSNERMMMIVISTACCRTIQPENPKAFKHGSDSVNSTFIADRSSFNAHFRIVFLSSTKVAQVIRQDPLHIQLTIDSKLS
jgi:hypothetical protein